MTADRSISVIGLGFGDCGKGLCTDYLVRRHGAHTVVRFNGGAQAGHNVVLGDGRHHTFSQFSSGSFTAGVATVLADPVVVHPLALLAEAQALAECGVGDAFARLHVDPRCRLTTPFHQAAGRLREWLRGPARHGSCGAGFGETVGHALAWPDEVLCWRHLHGLKGEVEARLEATRRRLRGDLLASLDGSDDGPLRAHAEWRVFADAGIGRRWLAAAREAAQRCAPGGLDAVLHRLARPGTLIHEGAQGMLLDEASGFAPHTTWSRVGTAAMRAVADQAGAADEVIHLGVVRSYLTRHGAGPLPTEDTALDVLGEAHNADAAWQGRFRRGHADALLLRYAAASAGPLDGLVVTHLDAVRPGVGLRWCEAYRAPRAGVAAELCDVDPDEPARIVGLRPAPPGRDQATGRRLGELLRQVAPEYHPAPIESAEEIVERVEAATGLPVRYTSNGPTAAHVAPRSRRTGVVTDLSS